MRISKLKLFEAKVRECEAMPKGYGLAYWDFPRAEAVCYPIPLNLMVRFARMFCFRIMWGLYETKLEKRWLDSMAKAKRDGWEVGRKYGYGQGKADGIAEMWGHTTSLSQKHFGGEKK